MGKKQTSRKKSKNVEQIAENNSKRNSVKILNVQPIKQVDSQQKTFNENLEEDEPLANMVKKGKKKIFEKGKQIAVERNTSLTIKAKRPAQNINKEDQKATKVARRQEKKLKVPQLIMLKSRNIIEEHTNCSSSIK